MRSIVFHINPQRLLVLIGLLLAPIAAGGQDFPVNPAGKMLRDRFGEYRASSSVKGEKAELFDERHRQTMTSWSRRDYVSKEGHRISVILFTTPSDAAAYSNVASSRLRVSGAAGRAEVTSANVGTEGFWYPDGIGNTLIFFRGPVYVAAYDNGKLAAPDALLQFGRAMAETLDKGEGEIPVLVKHLPGWPSVENPLYVINQVQLKDALPSQPVLEAVSFEGGTDAVIANYNGSSLVLIESKTPQLASDNDSRITAKIQELRSQGQTVPPAYRRVGNYSVFVFDAHNEQAANQLIDQVQYQQVVQWLGRNPTLYDRAVNEFSRTTLGVFIAVVKASGLVIIGSLALGGLLGAALFRMRRKQQQLTQAYSDAGGMLRLNIDELNATHDPARLIGRGN